MRDKLIELIGDAPYGLRTLGQAADELISVEGIADYLIANADVLDINVGKWIPVSERLPEKEGYYFVHHKGGFVSERYFYEEAPEMFIPFGNEPVTHWMPMPEPPKEGA